MMDVLGTAFLLSVVLLGIHSYFGIEIIKRGIIFTDLAIGQMAALGAAISLMFFDGEYLYLISLGFALMAGFLNSVATRKVKHQEAFIGLMYAFGVSGVFILLSKASHGMEEFQKLLAADILFTPLSEIIETAVLYSFLGLFLYFLNKRVNGVLKDILFFTTFAVTVTSSVRLAGVFVVFALLIGPAFIALRSGTKRVILWSWGIGIIINLIALGVSYRHDFPTGYTIVFFHALAAMLSTLFIKDRNGTLTKE
ncbi:MAG: metal ABC transporter permease [Candidatus Aminicenantes bacterium]|nr:metal ABC transporter permease [Candidatus Aminicenantes bacterium]MCK5004533.1 metal ABC transporter permease [Candidatus Aminicenantes bacterium]